MRGVKGLQVGYTPNTSWAGSAAPIRSTRLATASINEAVLKVPWEGLESGPAGEYVEVVDRDLDHAPRLYVAEHTATKDRW